MRRVLVFTAFFLVSLATWAQSPVREVKITVSNPTDQPRIAEDIVVPFAQLRQVAPEINAGSLVVIADKKEIPSQADDLDGDGKADELAFQIDLGSKQTRTVTIAYGEPDQISRMRSEYPKRTYAIFANKIEGLGWESDKNAWRLYFDPRNAIDLYGKRRGDLFLDILAAPEYIYHLESPNGRDIYKVGDALGIGAVGAWVDGKVVKVSDVATRKWRIISNGPVRSIIEITYEGWKVGGKSVTLCARIEQWAGDRGFFHSITAEGADGMTFATGLPVKPSVSVFRSEANQLGWLATYGEQVVQPGATATEELKGTNLGLAVVAVQGTMSTMQDNANYLMTFPLEHNAAKWYVAAAWDQEGMNNGLSVGTPPHVPAQAESSSALKTQGEFLHWLGQRRNELAAPAGVKIMQ
jgi:Domain of unknown function (DUF4861)